MIFLSLCLFISSGLAAQTYTDYEVSFENRVHHEARIKVTFSNLENKVLEVRMSRSSPGRYAVHDFAKNVYNVSASDEKGNALPMTRANPKQWNVSGHKGTVVFEYTLFANRAGGTYSGIDETHAHLNIPATFVWARNLEHRPIRLAFDLPENSHWKVATQLPMQAPELYYAPDLAYFMDSPIEIADLSFRSEEIDGQTIRLALHSSASEAEVDQYFAEVMKIVKQQAAVFGELPSFDFKTYTFLSCYVPNASGDGMEHRNSTYVVSPKPNEKPLGNTSMGTMSHEFFHAWNVERIRPKSLEPFDFEDANMSGELWFAEGFTSYYTNLIRVRSGNLSEENYINSLGGAVSYVMGAPGRKYFNPIEMSYRAPFVDAASSIDPDNNANIFISYYTYGSVLGLALDMSLRSLDKDKTLDGYMRYVWEKHGKREIPYTVRDLQARLAEFVDEDFAQDFFLRYIFDSQMPDYEQLFKNMGVVFEKSQPGIPTLGTRLRVQNGVGRFLGNPLVGSPVYEAGLAAEDEILSIAGTSLSALVNVQDILSQYQPGDQVTLVVNRWGKELTKTVTLTESSSMQTRWDVNANPQAESRRTAWLANR